MVDAEWPTSALDACEARGHRSGDDDPRHLDIAVDEDLLDRSPSGNRLHRLVVSSTIHIMKAFRLDSVGEGRRTCS